ncbi:unnamed protein product [Orchesella dallaii]|uniref:Gustatory receptor n=1 Tax=Orchesella dallaii TaxID=48710 RepID=A0ABP1R3E0_9HEXA
MLEVEPVIKSKHVAQNVGGTYELFSISDKNPISQTKNINIGNNVTTVIPAHPLRNLPYTIQVPQFLRKHFKFMYNTGFLPNKYEGSPISGIAGILKKTIFWIFSTLSVIDGVQLIKYFSIGYLHEADLFRYTTTLYVILKAFTRLNFLYLLVWGEAKIVQIQKTINMMADSFKNVVTQDNATKTQERWILTCIWTLTLAGSVVLVMFGRVTIGSGWSLEDTIKLKAFKFSEVLFVWALNITEVDLAHAVLLEEYVYNDGSYLSFFLGILCSVLEFFGYVLDSAVDDLFLLTSMTMYKLLSDFKFETVSQDNTNIHSELVWRHYRMLQNISKDVDLAFGTFLKISHFRNLIRCGYYIFTLTGDESFDVDFIIFTLSILKIATTYFIAAKASCTNKDFRRWIQRIYVEQTTIVVGSKHLQTVLIVDELATNPVGLGSGNFHIDESFAMKASAESKAEKDTAFIKRAKKKGS